MVRRFHETDGGVVVDQRGTPDVRRVADRYNQDGTLADEEECEDYICGFVWKCLMCLYCNGENKVLSGVVWVVTVIFILALVFS